MPTKKHMVPVMSVMSRTTSSRGGRGADQKICLVDDHGDHVHGQLADDAGLNFLVAARLGHAHQVGQLIEHRALRPRRLGADEDPAAVGGPALRQLGLADAIRPLDQHQARFARAAALHQLLRLGQAAEIFGFDEPCFHGVIPLR
ncbi:hypothetical protein GO496_04730 [Acidovorax citrulli]|nr:hypothetical protein [Paracidovorax citrulli]